MKRHRFSPEDSINLWRNFFSSDSVITIQARFECALRHELEEGGYGVFCFLVWLGRRGREGRRGRGKRGRGGEGRGGGRKGMGKDKRKGKREGKRKEKRKEQGRRRPKKRRKMGGDLVK
jgi:hypothetical protein